MQKDVVWFKELSNKDIPIAGGKGASLCEMYNAGFPIPPGFIITAQAYQKFLTQTGIDKQIYALLHDLDVDNNEKLQDAAKKVQKIIEDTQMPLSIQQSISEMYETMTVGEGLNGLSQQAKAMVKSGRDYPFVAVRSSATAEDLPSISEDEYVLLKANKKPLFGRMKDIFNQIKTGDEIFIPCMENGNASWKKVSQAYRHKVDSKKLFRITTETGRKITLSPNHTLITLDENTLQPKVSEISSLGGGEKVPVTKSIPLLDEKETFVKYIIDSLSNTEPAQNNIAYLAILLELFGIKFIIKSNEGTETIFLSSEELGKLKENIGPADFENIKTLIQVSAEPNKSLNCYLAINSNNRAAQLMASESILWDKIAKIEAVDYDSYVYDFSVPDVENFASGFGSIITHNSASFAGQQASFLNIRGTKQLLLSTQQCWASLFNARAIYYRIKNNFPHEKVLIAVVVQKMVNADKAGVMFSVNPISQDENEIMIETAWGLGEALVSGSVNPDQYIVDKKTEKIKSVNVRKQTWAYVLDSNYNKTMKRELPKEMQEKQKLSEAEIIVLAKLAKKAEEHYKAPQDLEYAIEKNKIMIVQSRPITTLKKHVSEEVVQKLAEAKVLTKGMSASPGVASGKVKIVANADELTKIEKGDVLVAVMTDPDYVAAMQRSSAIVTEQGGTTCFDGSTLLLTNKGFMQISNVCEDYEGLMVPSLNRNSLKIEWKPIIASMKRKADLIEIGLSQTGRMKGNNLRLTPDHKMITFENRKLVDKAIGNMLENSEMPLIAQKIPCLNSSSEYGRKKAYLLGAIMTDGSTWRSRTKGIITFVQKPTEEKMAFINTVASYMKEIYGKDVSIYKKKTSTGMIRGKPVIGNANAYQWASKQATIEIEEAEQSLLQELLYSDEKVAMNFLAGAIDGDGSFNHGLGRINIYVGDSTLMESLIVACLRVGVVPQVTANRTIYNIQIVEKIEEILKYTRRVKGNYIREKFGTRLFAARQLLGDIKDEVNYKGRTKPYIKNNLLLDSEKIKRDLLPLCNIKLKEEMCHILDSDTRMMRTYFEKNIGKIDVYNITVADNHNYIVFTDRFTPVIVNNCHAAIVSREMGIPCIVGTENATHVLKEGSFVTVDAINGLVYEGEVKLNHAVEENHNEEHFDESYNCVTDVKVIMDLPEFAEKAAATGADGVGLLRCEMMMAKHEHPAWLLKNGKKDILFNELVEGIYGIAQHFKGKPVWYRTSDFRTDEYRNLQGGKDEPNEDNPMLGWHGIRRSVDMPELIMTEFEAIKEVHKRGLTNVGVMLPMVTHVEQVEFGKKMLKKAGFNPGKDIEFGVMIETPASVQIIEEICKVGIDFVSFGTNDLTQFTMTIDRNNAHVQKWYDEMHPAVLKQIKHVIEVCKKYNVNTSICGQAGSRPEMAEFLVKCGIDSISANSDAVHKIRQVVSKVERKLLLEAARK